MTPEEKKKQLAQYAFANGRVTEEDTEAFIESLAKACPEAIAKDKNLTDKIDLAYEAMMIEQGKSQADVRSTSAPTAMPAASYTAEEAGAIRAKLANEYQNLVNMSQSTIIKTLVLDNVDPSEVIAAGAKGVISEKSWKSIMEKYADKVMPDDPDDAPNPVKSTTNFNALKAAFEAGQQVEVHIGKPANRVVAVHVQKPATAGANAATTVMDMNDFENYVVLETAGFVLATDTTPGAKLRYIKETTDKRDPGLTKPARSVLSLTRKQQAIEAGNVAVSRTVTDEIKEKAACKSELAFRVDTGKPKKNGTGNTTRLVRVTVNAPVKGTARKPEYTEVLGSVDRAKGAGDLLQMPDKNAMKKINQAQVTKIAQLRSKLASGEDFDMQVKYGDQLKAFGVQAAPAASVTV